MTAARQLTDPIIGFHDKESARIRQSLSNPNALRGFGTVPRLDLWRVRMRRFSDQWGSRPRVARRGAACYSPPRCRVVLEKNASMSPA